MFIFRFITTTRLSIRITQWRVILECFTYLDLNNISQLTLGRNRTDATCCKLVLYLVLDNLPTKSDFVKTEGRSTNWLR